MYKSYFAKQREVYFSQLCIVCYVLCVIGVCKVASLSLLSSITNKQIIITHYSKA